MAAEAAWQLLEEFTQKEARGLAQPLLDSPDKRRRLRDALLVSQLRVVWGVGQGALAGQGIVRVGHGKARQSLQPTLLERPTQLCI